MDFFFSLILFQQLLIVMVIVDWWLLIVDWWLVIGGCCLLFVVCCLLFVFVFVVVVVGVGVVAAAVAAGAVAHAVAVVALALVFAGCKKKPPGLLVLLLVYQVGQFWKGGNRWAVYPSRPPKRVFLYLRMDRVPQQSYRAKGKQKRWRSNWTTKRNYCNEPGNIIGPHVVFLLPNGAEKTPQESPQRIASWCHEIHSCHGWAIWVMIALNNADWGSIFEENIVLYQHVQQWRHESWPFKRKTNKGCVAVANSKMNCSEVLFWSSESSGGVATMRSDRSWLQCCQDASDGWVALEWQGLD